MKVRNSGRSILTIVHAREREQQKENKKQTLLFLHNLPAWSLRIEQTQFIFCHSTSSLYCIIAWLYIETATLLIFRKWYRFVKVGKFVIYERRFSGEYFELCLLHVSSFPFFEFSIRILSMVFSLPVGGKNLIPITDC